MQLDSSRPYLAFTTHQKALRHKCFERGLEYVKKFSKYIFYAIVDAFFN